MYTKEAEDEFEDYWLILDPEGNNICTVIGESSADALLSHLNR